MLREMAEKPKLSKDNARGGKYSPGYRQGRFVDDAPVLKGSEVYVFVLLSM